MKFLHNQTHKGKFFRAVFTYGFLVTALTGCNALTRLSEVGEPPKVSDIRNPTEKANYKPVTMPMPTPENARPNINSLWRPGSRAFFKDQRASRVGDILTVKISIKDKAELENSSEQNRSKGSDSLKINALAGMEGYFNKFLPESVDPTNLIDIETSRQIVGDGKIDRDEEIDVTMAAVVTQLLPNGNLVIEGTQEVRVNHELRQLHINGIIRREDITSQNTIESSQIAELRVAYGGRGIISDVQQPRYGRQLLDIIMPF